MFSMKKSKVITILLSFFLVLTACQTPEPETDNSDEDTTEEAPDENDEQNDEDTDSNTDEKDAEQGKETKGIEDHDFDLSLEDAVDVFQDKYGDMDVYAVELTTENQVYQYEIKGQKDNTEYKAHIHADNGDILDEKEEDDDDQHMTIDFGQLITPKEAMDKTLDEVDDGAFVTSWELGEEDGKMAYEVEYVFKEEGKEDGDIKIDAYSGDIMKD